MKSKLLSRIKVFAIAVYSAVLPLNIAAQNTFTHDWAIGYYGFNVDVPTSICTDVRSNIYSVGYFEDSIDMDTVAADRELWSHGLRDGYINKLDSSGNPIWSLPIGGSSLDQCQYIAYDGSSSLYISGTFNGTVDFDPGPGVYNLTAAGGYDAFLLKLDTNGIFNWAVNWGASSAEFGGQILIGSASEIYMIGTFGSAIDLDPGSGVQMTTTSSAGTFIVKLTSSGTFVWGGNYTASSFSSAALDGNGFIYLAGTCQGANCDMDPGAGTINFSTANNTQDIYVIKITINGSYIWHRTIGNTSTNQAHSVGVDIRGNVYLTGIFLGNLDFDPGPGSFMMNAGFTIDAFLCRLDTAGNFINAISLVSSTGDIERCYALQDSDGYFYLMGNFADAVDFNPSAAAYTLTSQTSTLDFYYMCMDSACNFMWASAMAGSGNQVTGAFCFDPQGNIISTHPLTGNIDADMGAGTDMLGEYNNTDIFVARMRRTVPLSADVKEVQLETTFRAYPIPCSSVLHIAFDHPQRIQAIHIFNLTGEQINVFWSATQSEAIVSTGELPFGIYIVVCESEYGVFRQKVIHAGY